MDGTTKANELDQALDSASPIQSCKTKSLIADAFEVIEKHRARKVPPQEILKSFNATYGLELKLPRFRQLLKAERINRSRPVLLPVAKRGAGQ